MQKKVVVTVILVALVVAGSASLCLAGDIVKIGVLAKNGPAKVLKKWQATGDYLTSAVKGKVFQIVPLGFDKVYSAIENGDVDFFLVNSSMFVTAKVRYGACAIATMINSRQGKPLKSFGGVIITTSYNDAIKGLADVKGKKFMAVKKSSFGGWQMAFKEFRDAGIDPYRDFATVEFGGKHDNVVFAVQNESVDAGTVRTDTLERMVAAGDIVMEDFKIIGAKERKDFPFVCSTALYPEWPLAKVAKTPDKLARRVVAALKKLKSTDKPAKKAKIKGWTDPLDYSGVERLQRDLQVGAYAAR